MKLVRHTRNLKAQNALSFFACVLMTPPPPSTNRFLAISCINVGVGPGGTTNLLAYFSPSILPKEKNTYEKKQQTHCHS